ncbi:MAG TPA: Asp-tRNA(Asn)/Glu-tRNA(Gln) amidotransferase GatCAB subunit B, partial [Rhodocyclaceae bacterium]|nr:Asp-tRNA(Asn)/Glu-tRNA(Gln) amidotransferase GatCAB subunit B [Rhodocyclaceae bacterium]
PDTGETRAMRSKEDAQDYRYFPDPDLLPLAIAPAWIDEVKAGMPELPGAMKTRFETDYGLSAYDAAALTATRGTAWYFEQVLATAGPGTAKSAANWITGELAAKLNETDMPIVACQVTPEKLAQLVQRIADNTISHKIAKDVFADLWMEQGNSADEIIAAKGLKQVSDASAIEPIIDQVLAENPKSVEEFRAGKEKAFNALVGQVMKASRGKANPQQVSDLLRQKLSG